MGFTTRCGNTSAGHYSCKTPGFDVFRVLNFMRLFRSLTDLYSKAWRMQELLTAVMASTKVTQAKRVWGKAKSYHAFAPFGLSQSVHMSTRCEVANDLDAMEASPFAAGLSSKLSCQKVLSAPGSLVRSTLLAPVQTSHFRSGAISFMKSLVLWGGPRGLQQEIKRHSLNKGRTLRTAPCCRHTKNSCQRAYEAPSIIKGIPTVACVGGSSSKWVCGGVGGGACP